MVGFSKYNVAVPSMANKLKDTNGNSTFGVVTSAIIDANIPMIAKMLMIKIVFFMVIGFSWLWDKYKYNFLIMQIFLTHF